MSVLKIVGVFFILLTCFAQGAVPGPPTDLRVNNASQPLGIDTPNPLFSWIVHDPDRNEVQMAYQLIVSSTPALCEASQGDVWDSGKIASASQNNVVYPGTALVSRITYWWKVRTWDKDNQASAWSKPVLFEMGFLQQSDWTASWIGGDFQRYRTEVTLPVDKAIVKARAYISARGIFDLTVNGVRVGGDRVMEPGESVYVKRMRYCTYDLAGHLKAGANAIGMELGRGRIGHWWLKSSDREFILQIELLDDDSNVIRILSDKGTWKTTAGGPRIPLPPLKSELYQGETYDARQEDGWGQPGFQDQSWTTIAEARPAAYSGRLCAQRAPPMKAGSLITPVAMSQPTPGVYVFDIGQKISGWSRLEVNGPRGATVTLRHAEKRLTPGYWDDYALSLNVRIIQGAAGIRFRIVDDRNYYLFQLKADGTLNLSKSVDGALTLLKRVTAELREGGTYTVRIEAAGSMLRTLIDGQQRDVTQDATFSCGKVGFYQEASETAAFDHVFVEPLTPSGERKLLRESERYLLKDGTRDSGFWLNLENLKTTTVKPEPNNPKSAFGQFTLTNNKSCQSYDGGTLGRVDQSNLHVFGSRYFADATDRYTLRGGGPEVWEPRFTLHGFQFVEVTGYPGVPTLQSIQARPAHQAVDEAPGSFRCSDPLLNKLHSACTWTMLNSLQFGMPVDCDQRDERTGWTGDAHAYSQAANYNYDMLNFYDSWLQDLGDTQAASGQINNHGPFQNIDQVGKYPGDTVWLSAYLSIPWDTYMATGSKTLIEKRYESMKALVEYLRTFQVKEFIDPKGGLVNWATQSLTGDAFTSPAFGGTAYLHQCVQTFARMAQAFGKAEDARFYLAQADAIQNAFNAKFLRADQSYAGSKPNAEPSQTTLAIALDLGLCPPAAQSNVTQRLVESIRNSGNCLKTGVAGTKSLLAALCENGEEETAFALATQTNYPSWGKWMVDGLTSCCEHWDDSRSRGHAYLGGSLDAYFYRTLAGIVPTQPGYETFTVKPHVKNTLTNVAAVVNSVRGVVSSSWSKPGRDHFIMNVQVPVNAKATVSIPTLGLGTTNIIITESGTVIWAQGKASGRVTGVDFKEARGGYLVWDVGSGNYSFELRRIYSGTEHSCETWAGEPRNSIEAFEPRTETDVVALSKMLEAK